MNGGENTKLKFQWPKIKLNSRNAHALTDYALTNRSVWFSYGDGFLFVLCALVIEIRFHRFRNARQLSECRAHTKLTHEIERDETSSAKKR